MRALVLVVAALTLVGCDDLDDPTPSPPGARPAPPSRARAAADDKARQDCRDNCEQTNILANGGDEALRACRDRCDARLGTAAPPHEVPSKITVAKPVHAPPLVRPVVR